MFGVIRHGLKEHLSKSIIRHYTRLITENAPNEQVVFQQVSQTFEAVNLIALYRNSVLRQVQFRSKVARLSCTWTTL